MRTFILHLDDPSRPDHRASRAALEVYCREAWQADPKAARAAWDLFNATRQPYVPRGKITKRPSISHSPFRISNFVRLFKPRFAPLVEDGSKGQTVRPTPKRIPKPGDLLSLRTWTGKPYRSKQRILREATVTRVDGIKITRTGILLRGR